MYKYTLAFLIQGNKVLLINRNKTPWMGSWNGVGGKIEADEQIFYSITREIKEETDIDINMDHLIYKGTVTWDVFDAQGNGLYLFICRLPEDLDYKTPKVVAEGILDWKPIDWAIDKKNQGIAKNIPYFLKHALDSKSTYNYHCTFEGDQLKNVDIKELIK
ncbi:8-oxo-dGTP diphosphatase [Mycoplasmatota bacterium]|nr:8-oxo-dGTP diphosphatase [Mycoplasmatota bacterium]